MRIFASIAQHQVVFCVGIPHQFGDIERVGDQTVGVVWIPIDGSEVFDQIVTVNGFRDGGRVGCVRERWSETVLFDHNQLDVDWPKVVFYHHRVVGAGNKVVFAGKQNLVVVDLDDA